MFTSRGRFSAGVINLLDKSNFVASSGFHRINITDKNFLPEYVALFLNSKDGKRALESIQEKATVSAITVAKLKELTIPSLSLQKQRQLINLTTTFFKRQALCKKQEKLQFIIINQIIGKIIGEQND